MLIRNIVLIIQCKFMKFSSIIKIYICISIYFLLALNPLLSADHSNDTVTDNVSIKNSTLLIDTNRILQSDYYYADNPRYTLSGELPNKHTKIKPIPAISVGALYTTVFILQHIGQMNTIWKERTDFKIMEDGRYSLYVDKVGHIYGCVVNSYVMNEALLWSGFDNETSIWIGGLLGLGYSTYIEVLDGYGKNWGFSPSDFYCDIIGTAFYVAQYYVPFLQNFTTKFNYIPSNWAGNEKRKPSDIFIDDYSSQTFWLSINIYNMLPQKWKSYWIDWLQLSIGYTANNLTLPELSNPNHKYDVMFNNEVYGDPKYLLSLDYDLVKLLPDGGNVWNWVKQSLNYVKFPSPTLEFSKKGTKAFLFYPFQFSIHL